MNRQPTRVPGFASVKLALFICCFLAAPAYAACTLSPAPSKVPDGATATQQEMIAALQTLKRYSTDVENYHKCLTFEANQNRLSRDEEARRHNDALDMLQAISARFNEQVRIFKARNK